VLPFDLADLERLPGLAANALACFGHIDYMVHNAGVAHRDRVINTDLEVDRRIMTTNYFGPVALTKALLPSMLQRRSGCFVVVSSLSGSYGGPQLSAYAASKHALHGFFESLRAEVHAEGIRITVITPGFIRTQIAEHALTGTGDAYGKALQVHERGMDPDRCATRMLKAIARHKEEALVGGVEVFSVYLKRFFPSLLSALVRSHPVRLRNALLYWMSFGTRGSRP
jgi:short-subunit dehydrogenase